VLKLPSEVRVFIALEPCDMRRQLDGLAALVRSAMERDPDSGDLYVFYNRRADMLKALFVDRHGPCMLVKRLSRGRFQIRVADGHAGHVEMQAQELAALLSELRFVRERANELEPRAPS
jgi:transposase